MKKTYVYSPTQWVTAGCIALLQVTTSQASGVTCRSDAQGNVTCRGDNGQRFQCRTDNMRNMRCRGQ